MDSRTQKPSQRHCIINLATFRSQNEPTDSADEAKTLMLALLALLFASDSVFPQTTKQRSFPSFAALEDSSAESAARYPLRWDPSQTMWKANIEGYGQSCPLSVGDRVTNTSPSVFRAVLVGRLRLLSAIGFTYLEKRGIAA